MPVRIKDGIIPYTGGQGIEITDNHVINVLLREMNNLIHVNGDRELYVDLQLPSGIKPTDTFPVGVTTGKILQADGWSQSGIILNWKTTSGDYVRLIYANDQKLYYDRGDGIWRELGGGDCKVHISDLPSVGDDITDLVSIARNENKILVFRDGGVNPIGGEFWEKRRYTAQVFSPSDGTVGVIRAISLDDESSFSSSLEITYTTGINQEFECIGVRVISPGELILTTAQLAQDQVDTGLVVSNVGNPVTGTVVDLSFIFAGGDLERISFDGGETDMELIYPCGSIQNGLQGTTPNSEFHMSAVYSCRLTGLVVNNKIYVRDFCSMESGA